MQRLIDENREMNKKLHKEGFTLEKIKEILQKQAPSPKLKKIEIVEEFEREDDETDEEDVRPKV